VEGGGGAPAADAHAAGHVCVCVWCGWLVGCEDARVPRSTPPCKAHEKEHKAQGSVNLTMDISSIHPSIHPRLVDCHATHPGSSPPLPPNRPGGQTGTPPHPPPVRQRGEGARGDRTRRVSPPRPLSWPLLLHLLRRAPIFLPPRRRLVYICVCVCVCVCVVCIFCFVASAHQIVKVCVCGGGGVLVLTIGITPS
jgi:hypothetical protein